jgi:pseudomonalisin
MQATRVLSLTLALFLLCGTTLLAGNGHSKRNVDDNDTVVTHGNVPPQAEAKNDRGPSDRNLKYEKMILLLQPRSSGRDSIERLVADLNNPSSPNYHKWLTPAQFGKRFGITDDDLSDVTDWLENHGFTIDEIAPGRLWVDFSGSVNQVERAFHTSIHDFDVDGKQYHGNTKDPEIPRALADVVRGVVTLHNFPKKAMNHGFKPVPEYTSGTSHYVAPADFATIYNVNPLYSAGINGTGKTIAIVGRTDIALADV